MDWMRLRLRGLQEFLACSEILGTLAAAGAVAPVIEVVLDKSIILRNHSLTAALVPGWACRYSYWTGDSPGGCASLTYITYVHRTVDKSYVKYIRSGRVAVTVVT